ncbi:virulence-associated E family protein [Candidatus Williamhamiltonella defendens]|uniref:ATPase n=2 Tax=Candidatus Williamhamiltonella defendens TaxID=138072 RepID=A0A249DYG2_9ENTR|nr:virulence-associated E family protein [Candidatus Hamiltonella defensa]ASX26120.1 ATPase [Candidatus Hamiltonella defensa (Bemisia tabaci)]CED78231.1 APSE-2 prophage predicted P-loop ATPase [Candidatus Hamiltonella defensa (Bemisia tabaci)]
MQISYSVGRSVSDQLPRPAVAGSFAEYQQAIKKLTKHINISPSDPKAIFDKKKKALNYIWGAMKNAKKGRNALNAGKRSVLWLDMDGCTLAAWDTLTGILRFYQCFAYTTASYEHPIAQGEQRWRIGFLLSREVTASEYKALGPRIEQELMDCFELLSDLTIKWDSSVYEPSHMVFAPHEGAKYESFEGAVVDVDTLLASDNTPVIEHTDVPKPYNDNLTRLVDLQNIDAQTFEDLRSALWYPKILNQAENYPSWVDMGNRLAWFKDTRFEDEAKTMWLDWSSAADKGDINAAKAKWPELRADRTGYQAIFSLAQKAGWVNPGAERLKTAVASVDEFDDLTNTENSKWPTFKRNKTSGQIEATIGNAAKAVMCADFVGVEIRFDTFRDEIMFAPVGTKEWQTFTDADYSRLRITMEKRGFKAVGRELIRDVVLLAAVENPFDSAMEWLKSLKWDGIARIEKFYHTHFGTEDTAYTRAVSRYMWTALAGRVLKPGIKADMVPILVGAQGSGKSSGVEALSPDPTFFTEISFAEKEDDLARKMRGCLVAEISELRGLNTKELESIKAFVTRTHEKWIPKFKEFATQFPRRSLSMGTTNEDEFLGDKTGNRRWLPVEVEKVNVDAIKKDVIQLWAEAREVFNKTGIQFEEAEQLANQVHEKYFIKDAWQEIIEHWLDEPDLMTGQKPRARQFLRSADILREALNLEPKNISRREQMRIGHVLQNCNFKQVLRRVDGKVCRVWERRNNLQRPVTT